MSRQERRLKLAINILNLEKMAEGQEDWRAAGMQMKANAMRSDLFWNLAAEYGEFEEHTYDAWTQPEHELVNGDVVNQHMKEIMDAASKEL